jgi:hypothetical protein
VQSSVSGLVRAYAAELMVHEVAGSGNRTVERGSMSLFSKLELLSDATGGIQAA